MPFDPNPTGDLKGDLNFQELARGLDQVFEGGVVVNDLDADVDFLVKALSGVVGLFVDGANGRVGVGTTSPGESLTVKSAGNTDLKILSDVADSLVGFRLQNDARQWRFFVSGSTSDELVIRDITAAANRVLIDALGRITLGSGSPRFTGRTATAADPTTTELPADKDFGLHKNTSSGSVFLAYNDGGVIKKVALT